MSTNPNEIVSFTDSLLAIAFAGYATWRGAVAIYTRTIGSRKSISSKIDQLDLGITQEFVEQLLGQPKFRTAADGHCLTTFETKHALIATVYDSSLTVVAFGLTVTDRKYSYDTGRLKNITSSVKLGTPGYERLPRPSRAVFGIGKRDAYYSESHWYAEAFGGGYSHKIESRAIGGRHEISGESGSPIPPTGSTTNLDTAGGSKDVDKKAWDACIDWARSSFAPNTLLVPANAPLPPAPRDPRPLNQQ